MKYDWNLPKQDKLKDWTKSNKESHGNCWQYAIAAVLQLPPSEVPDFLGEALESESDMDGITQKWLNERGFVLANTSSRIWFPHSEDMPKIPWLACGPSPRSKALHQHHVVVMIGNEMVYDPHPDGTGLTAIMDNYIIFPINPL